MPMKEIGMKKLHPKMPSQQISRSRIPTPSGMSAMRLKLGRHFRQQRGKLSSRDRPRAEARKEKEKAKAVRKAVVLLEHTASTRRRLASARTVIRWATGAATPNVQKFKQVEFPYLCPDSSQRTRRIRSPTSRMRRIPIMKVFVLSSLPRRVQRVIPGRIAMFNQRPASS